MQILKLNIILFLVTVVTLSACKDEQNRKNSPPQKSANESLVKANRYLVKKEKEEIENYIRRHDWEMHATGSGLRYSIIEEGDGNQVETGNLAILSYTTRLISGDLIYSSERDGLKEFVVGHGGVESGLEEMLLLMHKGDKVRLIIPSHLAFGLLGDDDKVPSRASLIYEMELIELK